MLEALAAVWPQAQTPQERRVAAAVGTCPPSLLSISRSLRRRYQRHADRRISTRPHARTLRYVASRQTAFFSQFPLSIYLWYPRSPTAESNGRLQAASRSRWGRPWLMHAMTSVHWIALLQTYILLCIGALKHILMAVQVCTVYNRALSILLLHNPLCQHWLRIHPVFQRLSNSFNVWLKWAMHKLRQSSRTHSSLPQL